MAATFINFTPSTVSAFTFQASIGGTQYQVTVTWNVFGQRYYVNVYSLGGVLIVCRALISCGPQLLASFVWSDNFATATTQVAHNVPLGNSVDIVVSQTSSPFDGTYPAFATSSTTLAYPLMPDPEEATPISGAVNFNLNLVEGVLSTGYLLFRDATQQFEYG